MRVLFLLQFDLGNIRSVTLNSRVRIYATPFQFILSIHFHHNNGKSSANIFYERLSLNTGHKF